MPKKWGWIKPIYDNSSDPPKKIYPPFFRRDLAGYTTEEMLEAYDYTGDPRYGRLYQPVCLSYPGAYSGVPCWMKEESEPYYYYHALVDCNNMTTGWVIQHFHVPVSGVRAREWLPPFSLYDSSGNVTGTVSPKDIFHFPKYDDANLSYFDIYSGINTSGPKKSPAPRVRPS